MMLVMIIYLKLKEPEFGIEEVEGLGCQMF